MAESPHPHGRARRAFLRKAGVAAGAAWVAPTVLSRAAHAQGTDGRLVLRVPYPDFIPQPVGSVCGGTLYAVELQRTDPQTWRVRLSSDVPIQIVDLQLGGFGDGDPPTLVPELPALVVGSGNRLEIVAGPNGPGITPASFFDVYYVCPGP